MLYEVITFFLRCGRCRGLGGRRRLCWHRRSLGRRARLRRLCLLLEGGQAFVLHLDQLLQLGDVLFECSKPVIGLGQGLVARDDVFFERLQAPCRRAGLGAGGGFTGLGLGDLDLIPALGDGRRRLFDFGRDLARA